MEFKKEYLLAIPIYIVIILIGVYFFGAQGGAVAGIAAPAIGYLVNAIQFEDDTNDGVMTEETDTETSNHSLVEPLQERKDRAKSRLSEHITLRENSQGEIELYLNTEDIRGADRGAMLYVFGRWAKADEHPESSSVITVQELRQETNLSEGAVGVFLSKMEHFIQRHYPEDPEERREIVDGELVHMDEAEMEFELNEDYFEEIVDYILGERRAPN